MLPRTPSSHPFDPASHPSLISCLVVTGKQQVADIHQDSKHADLVPTTSSATLVTVATSSTCTDSHLDQVLAALAKCLGHRRDRLPLRGTISTGCTFQMHLPDCQWNNRSLLAVRHVTSQGDGRSHASESQGDGRSHASESQGGGRSQIAHR